jgi:NADH:ubiquinone oxidoreductase subunit E
MSLKVTSENQAQANLLSALKEAQARLGYLSPEFMMELADSLHLPVSEVYGVASFYSFLATKPMGRNVIRICHNLPCYLKKGQIITKTVERELGISPGQVTTDDRFSFELVNCLGLCDQAPAMLINNNPHTNLTKDRIVKILQKYQ